MGYSWWLRIKLSNDGGAGRTVDCYITHGFGGGTRTEGGSVTKYSKFADRFACDIFVAGHDHYAIPFACECFEMNAVNAFSEHQLAAIWLAH